MALLPGLALTWIAFEANPLVLKALATEKLEPLQLTPRGLARISHRNVHILVGVIALWVVTHRDIAPR